uniref:Uncharacterized protein n=1 Tax=Solibacter usitatus (strain Ellin6076) TaxID=234267 RepID=Q01V43_SOLUE
MLSRFLTAVVALACLCGLGLAQEPAAAPALGYEDSLQIGYFTNGGIFGGNGGVFFPFTNAGFHAGPESRITSSDVCVNAYILGTNGSMGSCCSCRVPANSFAYILDGPFNYPSADAVVKLIATLPGRTVAGQPPSQCDARNTPLLSLGVPSGYGSGMRAWTESQSDLNSAFFEKAPFSRVPLTASEQTKLTQQCTATASQCTCLPAVFGSAAPTQVTSRPGARNPFGIK